MPYIIRKTFKVEYAHQLNSSYYVGCQNLHGHSAKIEVFLQADYLNKDEMVLDFAELKEIVGDYINSFDHVMIISKDASASYIEALESNNTNIKHIKIVDYNPTAENMAKDIYDYVKNQLSKFESSRDRVRVAKVRFHETETGYAEYFE